MSNYIISTIDDYISSTVNYISFICVAHMPATSSCFYTAQTQHKKRHDLVALYIHWILAKLAGFCIHKQWWKHVPEKVLDNSDSKILWDYIIQTGSSLSHNRPDITFFNKQKAEIKVIDVVILGGSWISQKSVEKRDRYHDLSVIVSI